MNRYLLLLALPLLAGCNVHSKNPANGDDNVAIQADENGSIAFNLPIAEGKVKIPASMMQHGNFDLDGVKLMPGSSLTGLNVDAHDENSTVDISFKTPASPDAVRAYFLGEFARQHVDAKVSDETITGKTKDGSAFTITLSPSAGGSEGKIRIQDKD